MITFYSSFLADILWKSSGIHVKDIICSNDFLEVVLYLETALQINVSHSYIICVLLNLHDCGNYWNATVWMALLYRNWVRAYKLFLFHAWKVHSPLFPWRKKKSIIIKTFKILSRTWRKIWIKHLQINPSFIWADGKAWERSSWLTIVCVGKISTQSFRIIF